MKRGGQVLAGILGKENFKEVERAMEEIGNAAGSADAEMDIIRDSVAFKLNELKQTWIGYAQELLKRDDIGKIIDALINASEKAEDTLDVLVPIIEKTIDAIAGLIDIIGNVASVTGGATPVIIGFIAAFRKRESLKKFKQDLLGIWDTIKKFGKFGKLFTTPDLLNTVLNTQFDDNKNIFANISSALESALKEGAENSTEAIAETVNNSTEAVKDVAGEVIGDSVVNDIKESTEILKDNIENEVKDIVDETGDFMEDMFMEQYNPDDNPMMDFFNDIEETNDTVDQFREGIGSTNDDLDTVQGIIEKGTAVKEAAIGADEANTKSTLEESVANEIEKDASLDSAVADEIEKDASLAAAGADAGEATGSGVSSAANGMTIATKIGSKLKTVLSGLAAAWPLVAAGAAIGVAAFYKWYTSCEQVVKRTDKAIDKIFELRDTFQEEADNAKESAEKLEDLAEKYQNAVEGSSEYYDIANKIAELEPSLIIGWTSEGDAILTTTEKIQDQVQAYKDLAEAKRLALEEENKGIVNEYANGDNALGLYKRKVEETKADIEHYNEEIEKLSDPKNGAAYAQERYNNSADIQIKAFENLRKEATKDLEVYAQKAAELEGKVHSAYASLLPTKDDLSATEKLLRDVVIDIGVSAQMDSDSFNNLYKQAEEAGKDIFDKLFKLQGNKELSTKEYQQQAEQIFNELVTALHLENDEEGQLALRVSLKIDPKSYANARQEAEEWAKKNGYNGRGYYNGSEFIPEDTDALKWYQDLNEEEQKIANSDEFTKELEKQKNKFTDIKDACQAAYDAVKAYGDETDEQGHKSVKSALEGYKVDENTTGQDKLDEYYDKVNSLQEVINKINTGDYTAMDLNQWRAEYDLVGESADEMVEELKKVEEESRKAVIEIIDKLIEANPDDTELINSLKLIKQGIEDVRKEAEKKINFNPGIDKLTDFNSALDSLQDSYINFFKEGKQIDPSSLTSIREVFGTLDEYQEFENAVLSGNGDLDASFDKLVTAYAKANDVLKEVNEENKQYYINALKNKGIINAQEVVEARLAHNRDIEAQKLKELNELQNSISLDPKTIKRELEKELNKLSKGGGVDLTLRPKISTKELEKAGWKDVGEGYATVFSSTIANEAGDVAINFTPILKEANGNVRVLSEDELYDYAEGVINGVHDDYLNLQIGAEFTGTDAIKKAEEEAEKVHKVQEKYYSDNSFDEISEERKRLIGVTKDLENATWQDIAALIAEGGQSDVTAQELALYALKKALAAGIDLANESDISYLLTLANAAGVAAGSLAEFAEAKAAIGKIESDLSSAYEKSGGRTTAQTEFLEKDLAKKKKEIKELQTSIQDEVNNFEVTPYDFTAFDYDGTTAADASGGGGSEPSSETFDWIETKIQRLERDITNLGKTADATYKTWAERTVALGQEMEKVNEQISLQETAYNAYMAKAESVGLSAQYKKLVQSGALKIDEITDETLKEQINNYKEWYIMMPQCLVISIANLFNCWNSLKLIKLQRRDEIYSSVIVAKAERIYQIA